MLPNRYGQTLTVNIMYNTKTMVSLTKYGWRMLLPEEKLKVLQENQLAGGSFWKLGLELPSIWDTIIKYIN